MNSCDHQQNLTADSVIPEPERQRLEVLGTFAESVADAARFREGLIEAGFPADRLLTARTSPDGIVPGLSRYDEQCLLFNTRYQYQPFVIAMCESADEVQKVYMMAIGYKLPVRVRAGGHDHAGESSGDNVILIDVTGIRNFSIDENQVAAIGAGFRFYQLTPELADQDRMIAHGTCATVGLAGFIQGGGWGPWTRKYGMCCEHLAGATMVLGDGTLVSVNANGQGFRKVMLDSGATMMEALDPAQNDALIWALRGGGGMSYGILTEIRVKTFALPGTILRFEIPWNSATVEGAESASAKTMDVLQAWEKVILADNSRALLGTNLQINALPLSDNPGDVKDLYHGCLMYGYWQGSADELQAFVASWFGAVGVTPDNLAISAPSGADHPQKYDHALMSHWGRRSMVDVVRAQGVQAIPVVGGTPFTPDYDAPAPHKITSRFVTAEGLASYDANGKDGYTALLESLTSAWVEPQNETYGLFCYVTLGAIQGSFYQTSSTLPDIAFDYRDCQYTIQYQSWWNETLKNKLEQQDNPVYVDVNRAMDWIDAAREADIAGTRGSFISFKDPSVPTERYFGRSYQRLVEVKQQYVNDRFNHLRSRKTII